MILYIEYFIKYWSKKIPTSYSIMSSKAKKLLFIQTENVLLERNELIVLNS